MSIFFRYLFQTYSVPLTRDLCLLSSILVYWR